MHTYSFPDAKNIVVCGDIHGHFNEVIFKMCVQYQMTDTLVKFRPKYYHAVQDINVSHRQSRWNVSEISDSPVHVHRRSHTLHLK